MLLGEHRPSPMNAFRENAELLGGEDVFAVLPTGFEKLSLCCLSGGVNLSRQALQPSVIL